jgi:hypothetical protein
MQCGRAHPTRLVSDLSAFEQQLSCSWRMGLRDARAGGWKRAASCPRSSGARVVGDEQAPCAIGRKRGYRRRCGRKRRAREASASRGGASVELILCAASAARHLDECR